MKDQKQYVLTLSGSRVAVIRIDILVSAKNTNIHRKFLDSIKINQEDCLNTIKCLKGILTKDGRVGVSAIGGDRLYDSQDAVLQKVTSGLAHETGSAFKKALLKGENTREDLFLQADELIDFVPSTECSIQMERCSSQLHHLFPVFIMGNETSVAYVEKFLNEIGSNAQALIELNRFIAKLPPFSLIKEQIPGSYVTLIPLEVDTFSFIRGRINADKRGNLKNKRIS